MNTLHTLPKLVTKSADIIGRGYGSRRGAKSGRGTTRHQAAREKIKEDYEGGQNKLTKKFPLLRGKAQNKSIQPIRIPITLTKLSKLPAKSTVTIEALVQAGIISKQDAPRGVKIVNTGDITKQLDIQVPISKTAAKKIANV